MDILMISDKVNMCMSTLYLHNVRTMYKHSPYRVKDVRDAVDVAVQVVFWFEKWV